jgi:hypothetical protein
MRHDPTYTGTIVNCPDDFFSETPVETFAILNARRKRVGKVPVRVLWSDAFFDGFPWGQPELPREFRDAWVVVSTVHELLRSQGRLVTPEMLPLPPDDPVRVQPDLLGERYGKALADAWLWLLGAATADGGLADALAVPTWARPLIAGATELRILPGSRTAALLAGDADWRAFVERHHKPDLRGRRVAVIGGNRAPFERAREKLATYGLTDCRRLPPAYEETRSKQETQQRLQSVELLIVCTNRMKHTDTDHLKGIEPTCTRVDLHADTEAQIEKAVVDHFRTPPPA